MEELGMEELQMANGLKLKWQRVWSHFQFSIPPFSVPP
jgi:hypothetical protein